MSIAVQGREDVLSQIWADGDVEAVYLGDEQVWPRLDGYEGYVMISPPATGTLKYLYWLHAVDNSRVTEATEENYLMFTVDGVDYYINSAPNGKQKVVMEGNTLKLTKAQQEALKGKIRDKLIMKCKLPFRTPYWRTFPNNNDVNNRFRSNFYLPLLPYTQIEISAVKGLKSETAYVDFYKVVSLPSGKELDVRSGYAAGGSGRYAFKYNTRNLTLEELELTDTRCVVEYNTYGSAGCDKGVSPRYPAFDQHIEVDVISIF